MLKSPCKSVDSFFNSVNFCLMHFKILLLSTYIIGFVMSSQRIDPFYHYEVFGVWESSVMMSTLSLIFYLIKYRWGGKKNLKRSVFKSDWLWVEKLLPAKFASQLTDVVTVRVTNWKVLANKGRVGCLGFSHGLGDIGKIVHPIVLSQWGTGEGLEC